MDLPPAVVTEINASVARFEAQWIAKGGDYMLKIAKSQGWIEDYRREVTELVKKTRSL